MDERIDRRITKSKKAIHNAFLEMLLERGFDAITVKDITEKADISRKTFYLHYVDKFDLLNTIVNDEMKVLERICAEKKDKGFVEGTIIWFQYFEQRKAFFAALFATESTISFRHRLLDFMMEQLDIKLENVPARKNTEVMRKFMGMAVLGVIESCVLNQFETDTKETARQVAELLELILQSTFTP